MTPTSDPRHEPEEHEPVTEQAPGDVVDFIDKTVAEITDAEVNEHLHRVLSRVVSVRPHAPFGIGFRTDPGAFSFEQVNNIMLSAFQKQATDAAAEQLKIAWDAAIVARKEAKQILAVARSQAAETAAQLINAAREEAGQILADAREEADQILASAHAEAERINASATSQAMTHQAENRQPVQSSAASTDPAARPRHQAQLLVMGIGEISLCTALLNAPLAADLLPNVFTATGLEAMAGAWEPSSVTALLDAPLAAGLLPNVFTATGLEAMAGAWEPSSVTALPEGLPGGVAELLEAMAAIPPLIIPGFPRLRRGPSFQLVSPDACPRPSSSAGSSGPAPR